MLPLEERYREILRQISPQTTLIAVTKTHPVEAIQALYHLGHRDFGENYVQELLEKAQQLQSQGLQDIRWHFIGHLQTNKVKTLIPWVHSIHTVDSEKLAHELSKRWKASGRPGKLPVFIEVNIDREESKSGLLPEEVLEFTKKIAEFSELEIQGLMCIPSPSSPEQVKAAFRHLKELEAQCRPQTAGQLSMGMSSDYLIALNEGATHIRLGTVLLGTRPAPLKR